MGRVGVGVGDMTKAVYDPDADGLIAVAQMEMTASKVAEGQGLGSGAAEIDTPAEIPDATVGDAREVICETSEGGPIGDGVWGKSCEINLGRPGAYRVVFVMSRHAEADGVYGRIYKNGSPEGTEQYTTSTSDVEYSEDLSGWSKNDLCQLYIKPAGSVYGFGSDLSVRTSNPIASCEIEVP